MGNFNYFKGGFGKVLTPLNEKLKSIEWGEFRVGDLFEVLSSKKIFHANNIKKIYEKPVNNSFAYVVRTTQNNGIKGYIIEDEKYLNEENTLSFAQDTFSVFYQKEKYFTGNKVKILKTKFQNMNEYRMKFITASLQKSLSRFSWGIGSTVDSIKNTKISLPIKNNKIDLQFMEEFIKEIEEAKLQKVKEYLKENNLENTNLTEKEKEALEKFERVEWGEFKFNEFFELCRIKNKLTKSNLFINGKIPVFSAESENNGIIGYTNLKADFTINSKNPFYIIFGDHTISFNFAKNDFCVADNVKVLSVKNNLSLRIVKFIITSWKKKIHYKGYARHWSIAKKIKIFLPVKNNQIDFQFMENLISALEKKIAKKLKLIFEKNLSVYN